MNKRTPVQTLLLVVGAVVLLGGLACVVMGFAGFADADASGDNSSFMLFAAGGFATVVGLGIVAFTRAAILTGNGGYTRVVIEQGVAPAGNRFCPQCGHPSSPSARFCERCGAAL